MNGYRQATCHATLAVLKHVAYCLTISFIHSFICVRIFLSLIFIVLYTRCPYTCTTAMILWP